MSDTILRAKLIRLAHEHPELREQILPLVASEGMPKEANVSIAVNEIREFSMHSTAFSSRSMWRTPRKI